jgi:hypothetical protein
MGVTFLLATAFRITLVLVFPTIHGGDAAARLANTGTLVLGYQLPLPQLFVVLGKAVLDDPVLVRLIFCVWGGLLVAGATALLSLGVDSRAAGFGAILLSFDPLLIHYSIVPYQEPVAYGLLAWAFYFAGSGRGTLGALLMASACLSRYEAWLFLPPFFWVARSRSALFIASFSTDYVRDIGEDDKPVPEPVEGTVGGFDKLSHRFRKTGWNEANSPVVLSRTDCG